MDVDNTKSAKKESDPNRGLRIMVIGMGVVLVGGFVLLFVLLALGVHKKDTPAKVKYVAASKACKPQQVALQIGEKMISIDIKGNIVTVKTENSQGGGRLIRTDICSGEVLRELVVQAGG